MDWIDPFMRASSLGWKAAMLSLLVAFALTQIIAASYVWTFRGLSYSRSLVQTKVARRLQALRRAVSNAAVDLMETCGTVPWTGFLDFIDNSMQK